MQPLTGTWRNQNGSELQLTETADGALEGRFLSRKGRAAAGTRYAVRGVRNGGVAAFFVNFREAGENLGSITSFSARLIDGPDGRTLHTVWTLAREYQDPARIEPTQAWNAFLTNADVFSEV
ncbi:MAG: hypothetical protein CMQ24_07755 [Gammaproteobacteria bacterium]|nr:hypothetical protein [Gammaproteobacteria bacterium]|tara:strand:- start:512 stop:877 length:366 start_codon:yes stop_codon:yes gene_type:complete